MTLVVNLFAGPGTGKSTNAALVFGKLKVAGINAELVHEFAKDLVWEKRHEALKFQPYVITKQHYHIHRLIGQVDVIITDSPILLAIIYGGEGFNSHFAQHLMTEFGKWNTLNVYLDRNTDNHAYNEAGRSQTEEEAKALDLRIEELLYRLNIPRKYVPVLPGEETANRICSLIYDRLK